MSKTFSAKYYQKSKERLACGRYQNLSKVKKQQNGHGRYKISQKMKNKSLLSIEKKYYTMRKTLYYNYKKVPELRKFCFFIRESIRNVFLFHLYKVRFNDSRFVLHDSS